MHRYWERILQPLARAAESANIAEVGAELGTLTAKLLAHVERGGGTLYVIDPLPRFDYESWEQEHPQHFRMVRDLSIRAIPTLPPLDFVCLDGDHNWYTVFQELQLLEARATQGGAPPPIVALHDVDWPYGRRDMYYDPTNVPAEHRHPSARRGILPNRSELNDSGLNNGLHNALHEGGPRNGVRTAIEDFFAASPVAWTQLDFPGFHGVTVLIPAARREASPALDAVASALTLSDDLVQHLRDVENSRIAWRLRAVNAERRLADRG